MRMFLAALLVIAPITGCATLPEPGTVADQTTMDERGRIAFGLAYVTASRLGNPLSRVGIIDRTRFRELDRRGYAALVRVRQAYAAGNATDYRLATAELQRIITEINSLVGE